MDICEQYEIDSNRWNVLIGENTMVDPKKNRVNDGILFPMKSLWSPGKFGVFKPGNAQEDILPITEDLTNLSATFAIVKVSYVRRLRMASYTDHFPVYVYVKKPSEFKKGEEEKKLNFESVKKEKEEEGPTKKKTSTEVKKKKKKDEDKKKKK
jgi:hypothetical protein